MATGYNHTPVRPSLPGLEGFAGQLVLASDYRNGSQFAGRDVLVVRLPTRVVDRVAAAVARMTTPDLTAYGLPRPDTGLLTRVVRDGAIPVQDVGIIDAILSGRVEPVAAIREIDGPDVVLADGSRARPDTLVLATGYRRGLEPLVGHLDVLDGRGRPVVRGGRNAPGAWPLLHRLHEPHLGHAARDRHRRPEDRAVDGPVAVLVTAVVVITVVVIAVVVIAGTVSERSDPSHDAAAAQRPPRLRKAAPTALA